MIRVYRTGNKLTLATALLFCLLWSACTNHLFTDRLKEEAVKIIPIAEAWANNSVNAVIFRRNSLVTHGDVQYAAFYDPDQYLVLAKREHGSAEWLTTRTAYQGQAADAHNSISIMVDGAGYLHVAWDHHNNTLRYARSTSPGTLELGGKVSMTGLKEDKVTYPEFYKMPDGRLLFFYRYGASGNGELVINRYDPGTQQWTQLQSNLIDGQGERNAYWQACVDGQGTIHVSWVWRESWDVATNHDLSYARSKDGGKSWENSKGHPYALPITLETAELAWHIPQNSELINQTSMTTDSRGNPVIATYWRPQGTEVPQFYVVYADGQAWQVFQVSSRNIPFSLSGGGTKRIPISRPQIMLEQKRGKEKAVLVFRDEERGNKVSVAINEEFPGGSWETRDLTTEEMGAWEPSYDTERWKEKGELHLFVQKVEQLDGEGLASQEPELVKVLEWED
jgi:hypothetical protein